MKEYRCLAIVSIMSLVAISISAQWMHPVFAVGGSVPDEVLAEEVELIAGPVDTGSCWTLTDKRCDEIVASVCDDTKCVDDACPSTTVERKRIPPNGGDAWHEFTPTTIPGAGFITFRKTGESDCTIEKPCGGACVMKNGNKVCQPEPGATERKVSLPQVAGVNQCHLFGVPGPVDGDPVEAIP